MEEPHAREVGGDGTVGGWQEPRHPSQSHTYFACQSSRPRVGAGGHASEPRLTIVATKQVQRGDGAQASRTSAEMGNTASRKFDSNSPQHRCVDRDRGKAAVHILSTNLPSELGQGTSQKRAPGSQPRHLGDRKPADHGRSRQVSGWNKRS